MILLYLSFIFIFKKELSFKYKIWNFTNPLNSISKQGVKEIDEQWSNMKFTVHAYMKGTSNRGWILGAVDEILQILDDSSMNLQSMSASRFVGPFLNSVQNWEKSLSHISEVLDVS